MFVLPGLTCTVLLAIRAMFRAIVGKVRKDKLDLRKAKRLSRASSEASEEPERSRSKNFLAAMAQISEERAEKEFEHRDLLPGHGALFGGPCSVAPCSETSGALMDQMQRTLTSMDEKLFQLKDVQPCQPTSGPPTPIYGHPLTPAHLTRRWDALFRTIRKWSAK